MSSAASEKARANKIVPIDLYRSPKWIRAKFADQVIADSRDVLLWRGRWPMSYYFPRSDVATLLLQSASTSPELSPWGPAQWFSVRVEDRVAFRAAWSYLDPPSHLGALKDRIAFDWKSMDGWFEEERQVFVHPRDPFVRVDVVPSSRRVQVVVDGVTVADSKSPVLLFETGVQTRYYLPEGDVRTDLFIPSDTVTRCPYKGEARYCSLDTGKRLHQDIAWYYPFPFPEAQLIASYVCFYTERVDAFMVDGALQPRRQALTQSPITPPW